MRKLVVLDARGWFTVSVPDDAKITFGPTVPFTPSPGRNPFAGNENRDRSYSLRVYKGSKENLLAVFPAVMGFRDEEIKIAIVDADVGDTDVARSRLVPEMAARLPPGEVVAVEEQPRRRAATRTRRVTAPEPTGTPDYNL